jgi:hypothetical protein
VHINYRQWAGAEDFAAGRHAGTRLDDGALVIEQPADRVDYDDPHDSAPPRSYDVAHWTSPTVPVGFAFTELVASWNSHTPAGTWVAVQVEVCTDDGVWSGPYELGRWAMDAETIKRTSVPGQRDEIAEVDVDTLRSQPRVRLAGWRLTVSLHRRTGSDLTPRVGLVGAVTSTPPAARAPLPERSPGAGSGLALDVPTFSQEVHADRYLELSGGGTSWCSPTATSMVLAYFDALPEPASYAWVEAASPDPWVVHAAAKTYDWVYGAGNWPFNVAYASELGLRAFVTRLRTLDEAERFVAAGIPLVASISFAEDELAGAGYTTEGHLLVIVGFTETHDVIVHDPASHKVASSDEVRTVYDRDQFTAAWQSGSGGIVYVLRPADRPLPAPPDEPNWPAA